jgi:enoyl-CoA hydratase/carnithine racemase
VFELSKTIIFSKEKGIATITLNRPEVLNALTFKLIDEFIESLQEVKEDEDARVLVVKGAGRAFCAGDDLRGMREPEEPPPRSLPEVEADLRRGYVRLIKAIRSLEKPVIASINGYALGAGFDLALACDFRIASEETRFGAPYVLRGLVGGLCLLPLYIGIPKATELLFTGRIIDAKEAEKLGLVNIVVPADNLEKATRETAEKFAKAATKAVGLMKKAINQTFAILLDQAIECQIYASLLASQTEDVKEGITAFIEKREPNFKGK